MNFGLKGKKVLVTGAGKGIGRALAVKLNGLGLNVVALSRTQEDLEKLKLEHPSVATVQCDLLVADSIEPAIGPHLPFDLLINNAGIAILDSFLDTHWRDFDKVLAVNTRSALVVSQIVCKSMIEHNIAGSVGASKAALDSLCKSMALELGQHKIRVNCVNPTVVWTEMGKLAWSDPSKARTVLDRMPLHRFASEEEVCASVLFLLSEASSLTTGQCLYVDGGQSIT